MEGVDEVGIKELPDRGDPAAEPYILALRRLARLFQDRGGSPSTKWNVVSDSVNEGRLWWVMTNTGVRNGAPLPTSRATDGRARARAAARTCYGP